MMYSFKYGEFGIIEIKYDECNTNIDALTLRLEQLERYLNKKKYQYACDLVEVTFNNTQSLLEYYYSKCSEKGIAENLTHSMLMELFDIFDNILMYCYALISEDYAKYKNEYKLIKNFLQQIYNKFENEQSVDMSIFVLPFKGKNSLCTEEYFYKLPNFFDKKLGMSIEELSEKYEFKTICMILDPHNYIKSPKLFTPIALHEISHHIKIVPREERNYELKNFILKKLSDELTVQLLSRNSNANFYFLQGLAREKISEAIYYGIEKSFTDFLDRQSIDIKEIKFVDFRSLFNSFINTWDFETVNQIVVSRTSDRIENIKKEILRLQSYLEYAVSSRFDSLQKSKDKIWYIEKLYSSMFYDLLFDEDIDYWKNIDTKERPKQLMDETDREYEIRCKYFNAICELHSQYKPKIKRDEWQLSPEMFSLFANSLVNQLSQSEMENIYSFGITKKELEESLLDMVDTGAKDLLHKDMNSFENSIKEIIIENETAFNYGSLFHRLIDIKQHITTLKFLINAYKNDEKIKLTPICTNNELSKDCFLQLRKLINSSIKSGENYFFLMTQDFKDVFFKLGLFSDSEEGKFKDIFNDTLNQVGKKEFKHYIKDLIDIYKETFADLFMCWTLNFDGGEYREFFKQYKIHENLFLPTPEIGNDFSSFRTKLVFAILKENANAEYLGMNRHFCELKSIWENKYSKSINRLCRYKKYNSIMPNK